MNFKDLAQPQRRRCWLYNQVVFLDKGQVAEHGPAREVLTNPKSDRLRAFLSRLNPATRIEA